MAKKRLEIMKDVVAGKISVPTAAAKLGRSVKTVQRYRKELLENPQAKLEHKNLQTKETTKKSGIYIPRNIMGTTSLSSVRNLKRTKA